MNEKKYFNVALNTATAGATTWNFSSPLGGIVAGTGATNRIGNKIFLHSITFMITIYPVAAAGMADGCMCRVVFYHNVECNGAIPTGTTMFNTDTVNSNRAVPYLPKIKILDDVVHQMVATATNGATVVAAGPIKIFKKVVYPKRVIDYVGNAGTIADILKHDYGYGFASEMAGGCNVDCNCQVIFSDA